MSFYWGSTKYWFTNDAGVEYFYTKTGWCDYTITICGTGEADTIYGYNCYNNEIFGKGGDDFLDGGNKSDTIFGGADNDTIEGDGGDDKLNGDEGMDVIHGGKGHDKLFGGDDNDMLFGGSGNDDITGGADNGMFASGTGGASTVNVAGVDIDLTDIDDQGETIILETGLMTNTIIATTVGRLPDGDAILTIENGQPFAASFDVVLGGGLLVPSVTVEPGQTAIVNIGASPLGSVVPLVLISTTQGVPTIVAGPVADNDIPVGGGGTEFVQGDVLTGGDGHDDFFYYKGDGVDTITDFNKHQDELHVDGFDRDEIEVVQDGADTIVYLLDDGGQRQLDAGIILQNVSADYNDLFGNDYDGHFFNWFFC